MKQNSTLNANANGFVKENLLVVQANIEDKVSLKKELLEDKQLKVNFDSLKNKAKVAMQLNVEGNTRAIGHNDPDHALLLDNSYINSARFDSILGNGIENWYYFSIPITSPRVRINYRFKQAIGQNCMVALYQMQSNYALSLVALAASGEDEMINYIDNSSTGIYFLRVMPLTAANGNPYEFYMQLDNTYDLAGSNFNNPKTFNNALSDEGKVNFICDQQYYKITFDQPGSYTLASPLGSNYIIRFYDQNLNSILAVAMQNEVYQIKGFNAGVYYVTVGYYGDPNSFIPVASYPLELVTTRIPCKVSSIKLSYDKPQKVNWNQGMRFLVQSADWLTISGRVTDSSDQPVPFGSIKVQLLDDAWSPKHGNNFNLYQRYTIVTTDQNGDFKAYIQAPVAYGLYSIYTARRHIYDVAKLEFYKDDQNYFDTKLINDHTLDNPWDSDHMVLNTPSDIFYIQGY